MNPSEIQKQLKNMPGLPPLNDPLALQMLAQNQGMFGQMPPFNPFFNMNPYELMLMQQQAMMSPELQYMYAQQMMGQNPQMMMPNPYSMMGNSQFPHQPFPNPFGHPEEEP